MNINRLARNHQMMYNFINRGNSYAPLMQEKFNSSSGSRMELDADSLLKKMGMDGLEGRTVREMAKYKLEQQKKIQDAQQSETGSGVSSLAQQFYVRSQYTPISDKATAAMQELAMQDAISSAGGAAAPSTGERVTLIQEQLEDVVHSKRAAAFNTMNKVWESELNRIGEYIKENDPEWNSWGDKFDPSILENYEPGVNIWV